MSVTKKIYSMQVPDEQLFVLQPLDSLPVKKKSLKFIKDDSGDSQQSQAGQNSNQTQTSKQTKQHDNQLGSVQKDQVSHIKRQKRQRGKKKNKKQMSTNNKQQKKEKFNCRFYMQGSCKNGTTCKFTHPVQAPMNQTQFKKPKQSKQQPYSKIKKQSSSQMKEDQEVAQKYSRDMYFQKMIESMKQVCYSCSKRDILVTLSCGCHTICEVCVKGKMACSKENHLYDNKVYIK